MIIKTNITSIKGVMFISIIGSGSAFLLPEPEPTFILMVCPLKMSGSRTARRMLLAGRCGKGFSPCQAVR
jgi:hypothetical protein